MLLEEAVLFREWKVPIITGLLGHDWLATTEIYLNLSPEDVIREFHSKW